MTAPFQWIDTPAALRALVTRLRDVPCVALDTEFVWERTYYARLGLVQLALPEDGCFLVDPIATGDLAPLGDLLADAGVTKILHDAPQDLMILRRATGASTRRVFDTRLAAGFTGLSATLSLSNLVGTVLDVHLPKEHTRANWMARPLAPEVLDYATDDVRYLPPIADRLRARARAGEVEAWLDEELATLDASPLYEDTPPQEAYRRLRAADALPPRNLAVLRELAAWREEHARAIDRPRRWLAEDRLLVDIALALPQSTAELQRVKGMHPKTLRHQGKAYLAAVQRGLAVPDNELPAAVRPAGRDRTLKPRVDRVLRHIRACAAARGIDPRLVGARNDVARLVAAWPGARPAEHALLRGWRADLVGDLGAHLASPKTDAPAHCDKACGLGAG